MNFGAKHLFEIRERLLAYEHEETNYTGPFDWREGDPAIAQVLFSQGFGSGGDLDMGLLEAASKKKNERYGGDLFAIVPLYVTSICAERCLYCNFRAGNRGIELQRIRLLPQQVDDEARYLVERKGLRVIELVYATDPLVRVDRMCKDVERTKKLLERYGGGAVGINAEALDVDEYRRLKDAGLDFIVLWQETYDRDQYIKYHPGATKKTHFEYRLEAYDRMFEAGIHAIGMGVLSGLSDWRMDWTFLMEHEAYIARKYGVAPAILGVPRLKSAAGALVQSTPCTPSRQEYKCVVALHNLFAPTTLPFLNTREDWDLCTEMASGGGSLFTFNCSTIPGGYVAGTHGYQFPTANYDAPVFAPLLTQQGFNPVFDWRFPENGIVVAENPLIAALAQ